MVKSLPEKRICSICENEKPIEEFYQGVNGDYPFAFPYCKKCNKANRLQHYYGLTMEEYRDMVRSQEGRCPICHRKVLEDLVVDHDHKTGKVRGLLCGSCNKALGLFQESEDALFNAIGYLRAYREPS